MELCDLEWKEFFLDEIFSEIKRGKRLKKDDHVSGNFPYVSSSALNNGVDSFVGNKNKVRKFGKCLSLANSGSVGACFYEPFEFVASDHVTHLKGEYSPEQYLFMANMLNRLSEKYNFNREINDERIAREKILLPVNKDGEPIWDFIEKYIFDILNEKKRSYKVVAKKRIASLQYSDLPEFSSLNWKDFYLQEIFSIKKGNQNKMNTLKSGNIPLVSAKKNNNAYKTFVTPNNKELYKGNCITINNDGDGGAGLAFYQPYTMALDSHCTALFPLEDISEDAMLFISMCLTMQNEQFGHGHSLSNGRMTTFKFMLPVNNADKPDYVYMEKYIRNLKLKKYKEYIAYVEK